MSEPLETGPDPVAPTAPDHCVLQHDVFKRVPGISFRLATTDGMPVMVVPYGEREASVPLRSLQHEFGIADDAPDGRMLGLIAESLDYVTALHPGDRLPEEVVSGAASWTPSVLHRQRAVTRLRLNLLAWLDPAAAQAAGRDVERGHRLDSDPELRTMVQKAFRMAATELGLASPEELVAQVERLAEEFACIETLRERLLEGVQDICGRATRIDAGRGGAGSRPTDALSRMRVLITSVLESLRSRFEDIDAQTGEIMALLRNPESQIAFVRSNRDGLYRSLRGWEPLLERWQSLANDDEDAAWPLVADTYRFLARRHLPASEWPSSDALRQERGRGKKSKGMAW